MKKSDAIFGIKKPIARTIGLKLAGVIGMITILSSIISFVYTMATTDTLIQAQLEKYSAERGLRESIEMLNIEKQLKYFRQEFLKRYEMMGSEDPQRWFEFNMQKQADGTTRSIRALPQGIEVKIVAVTASVLAEQQQNILACGCDELIHKPFREHEIFEAMARHLGVDYLYREAEKEQKRIQQGDLTAEMLAALPAALLAELHATILTLNREASLEVITRIEEQTPETGQCLRDLVENFQMGRISKLLGENGLSSS